MRKSALTLLLLCTFYCASYGDTPHHSRISLYYTSPKGIGYNRGYTSLEGFFAPANFIKEAWLPFVDLRGHVFDNGRFAANAGLGLRYLGASRVWGVNAYYDYRDTKQRELLSFNHHKKIRNYNQVAVGLESLGCVWDLRLNGYLPVGKLSNPLRSRFDSFKDNHLLLSTQWQFSMKGVNAEVGAHFDYFQNAPIYVAAGPYFFHGLGKSTWGGELRGSVELFSRYFRLEAGTSYDRFFHWRGYGQLSLNIPIGYAPKASGKCIECCALRSRAVQRVDRFEIMPLAKQHRTSVAVNPATEQPWFFWFVDNTSSSTGSFESPFPTLVQAQNASQADQAIYVFPGNGTTQGMDRGIILKESQLFLGASVAHTIPTTNGPITIPPLASSLPNITNISGDVVTLASNNTVSGFSIAANFGNGISGNGITNFIGSHNTLLSNTQDTNGINLINPSGQACITDSSFSGFANGTSLLNGNGIYVELDTSTLDCLTVGKSSFNDITKSTTMVHFGANGILVLPGNGTLKEWQTYDCSFNNIANDGINTLFFASGAIDNMRVWNSNFNNIGHFGITTRLIGNGTLGEMSISKSSFNNISQTGIDLFLNSSNTNSTLSVSDSNFNNISQTGVAVTLFNGVLNEMNLANNQFSNIAERGVDVVVQGGTLTNATISNSTFSDNSLFDINITTFAGTLNNMTIAGNTFTNIISGGVGILAEVAGGTFNSLTIANNTFSNISGGGSSGINATQTGSVITNMSVSNNTFSSIVNTGNGIFYKKNFNANNFAGITGNTFTGGSGIINGFAAHVEVDNGTTCVDFTQNDAEPSSSPVAYQFVQSNGGVFNRTTGSDNTTNTGSFLLTGAINPPGSCSE